MFLFWKIEQSLFSMVSLFSAAFLGLLLRAVITTKPHELTPKDLFIALVFGLFFYAFQKNTASLAEYSKDRADKAKRQP